MLDANKVPETISHFEEQRRDQRGGNGKEPRTKGKINTSRCEK